MVDNLGPVQRRPTRCREFGVSKCVADIENSNVAESDENNAIRYIEGPTHYEPPVSPRNADYRTEPHDDLFDAADYLLIIN